MWKQDTKLGMYLFRFNKIIVKKKECKANYYMETMKHNALSFVFNMYAIKFRQLDWN